ncbi:MAG: hypothetical protein JNL74_23025 [Fibrobacteres bacterium]|nr:hypothetical protein [Fibrobacterota bacterium]
MNNLCMILIALLMFCTSLFPQFPTTFLNWSQMRDSLAALETANPTLCKVVDLGDDPQESTVGYRLLALKISDNVETDETGEAEIMHMSGVHGNEGINPMMAWYFARDLIQAYQNSADTFHARAVKIVEHNEMFIIPFVNPESNMRLDRLTYGVDPNRDWSWGYSKDDTYIYRKGPLYAGMSRNIMTFICNRNLIYAQDNHSVSYGAAGYVSSPAYGSDKNQAVYIAEKLDTLYPPSYLNKAGTSGFGYAASQTAIWGGHGVLATNNENGHGIADYRTNENANDSLLRYKLDSIYYNVTKKVYFTEYSTHIPQGVWGIVSTGTAAADASVWIYENSRGSLMPVRTNLVNGEYQKFLKPGTVVDSIVVHASGYVNKKISGSFTVSAGLTEVSCTALTSSPDNIWAVHVPMLAMDGQDSPEQAYTIKAMGQNDSISYQYRGADIALMPANPDRAYVVLDIGQTLRSHDGAELKVFTGNNATYEIAVSPDTARSTGWLRGYASNFSGTVFPAPWVVVDTLNGDQLIDMPQTISAFRFVRVRSLPGQTPELMLDAVQGFNGSQSTNIDGALKTLIPSRISVSPNPFNASLSVSLTLRERSRASIRIFDTRGVEVERLFDGNKDAGTHKIIWKMDSNRKQKFPSSLYFVRLETEDYSQTIPVLLAR